MDKNMEYNNFYGYSPYGTSPDGFESQYAEFKCQFLLGSSALILIIP